MLLAIKMFFAWMVNIFHRGEEERDNQDLDEKGIVSFHLTPLVVDKKPESKGGADEKIDKKGIGELRKEKKRRKRGKAKERRKKE